MDNMAIISTIALIVVVLITILAAVPIFVPVSVVIIVVVVILVVLVFVFVVLCVSVVFAVSSMDDVPSSHPQPHFIAIPTPIRMPEMSSLPITRDIHLPRNEANRILCFPGKEANRMMQRNEKKQKESELSTYDFGQCSSDGQMMPTIESLNYSLIQIHDATNNFSEDCMIGSGGFGLVYKGILPNGDEIAVKRLSERSRQGLEEFKNEIMLLAKLKHKNLVRLIGFCFENQEMILVYEYFPNKSLDNFLFDPKKQRLLDWTIRYKIIEGIAAGLLYLHEDSQLRIIHRDLKASNILLDENMNLKIADFGIARLLQVDQSEENTNRIFGTFLYMAPEYAMYGQISGKSDVFSFGVLLLEVISGQNSSSFYQSVGVDDLKSHAWKNFRNGLPLALLDPSVGEDYARNEVIQCIHIGLLCVQEDPQSRPTMASVVQMLSSNSTTLPNPIQPVLCTTTMSTWNMMQPEHYDTFNKFSLLSVLERDRCIIHLIVPEITRYI